MNKLTIIGNITNDPELRTTQDGISVCSFTVAVNRKQTAQQKQAGKQPEADFFHVTAWRERGEICARYLDKGKKVCVIGPVSVRQYDTQDGRHGASLEMVADEVEFLSPRTEEHTAEAPAPVDAQTGFQQVETDDLPF